MSSFSQLGFTDYNTYIQSPYFSRLRKMVEGKKCFVSEVTYSIIAHHVRYDNLGKERLYRDVFPVAYDVHTLIHFVPIYLWKWHIFTIKTPLTPFWLMKRMLYLRLKFCIQKRYFWRSIWYFFRCLTF